MLTPEEKIENLELLSDPNEDRIVREMEPPPCKPLDSSLLW